MSIEQQLLKEALSAGVAVEQIGRVDGVMFEVEGELITLRLGEEGDEQFDQLEEAATRIRQYGEEYGGDGSRPAAIIRFVTRLAKLVAHVPESKRLSALVERLDDDVEKIARQLGLEYLSKVYREDGEITADDEDIGFFEDGNGALWRVYFEERVAYELFDRDD